jgi:ABC-type nitrate/sulfonate/bicarbonate transport system substrate-binding protein
MSIQGVSNVNDVPSLMALADLEQQGYQTEIVGFAKGSLILPALLKGDINLATASNSFVASALAEGADIRTIAGRSKTTFLLVAKADIRDCHDLDGRSAAFSSKKAVGYHMYERYVEQHCPGMAPEILLISGSDNRVVALQAGEVDAAYLGLEDWLHLQKAAPGEYRLLIDFPREFPEVQMFAFSVRREWAEENADMVEDFLRALLEVHRQIIEDSQLLADGIAEYVDVEADWAQTLADEYLAVQLWDPNGQFTTENLRATLDFFREREVMATDLTVAQFADLTYLDAVLEEIGRW